MKRAATMDLNIINSYTCNVWMFDHEELAILAWTMFDDLGLVSQFKIPQVAFFQLMETLKVFILNFPVVLEEKDHPIWALSIIKKSLIV